MTGSCEPSSSNSMRHRIRGKFTNRSLIYLLLVIVLVTSLAMTQIFLYFDAFNVRLTRRRTGHGLPEESRHFSDFNFNRHHLTPYSQSLELTSKQLLTYHNKSLTLRRHFNCKKLFKADPIEQAKVTEFHMRNGHAYTVLSEEIVPEITRDCEEFRKVRGYASDEGSSREAEFPLAYIILVHKDFEHLERLLKAIYRPQHSFCIHVDRKATETLKTAVSSLVRCFSNVILASEPQSVTYAHMSRLMADIVCMQDLVLKDRTWRYLINYAATEFPLKSNLETVQILQVLGDLNDIHEQYQRRLEKRFKHEHEIINGKMKQTLVSLPPPPYNMTVIKGQAYNTFSRKFIEWALTDEKPKNFLKWSNKTFSPDEHFWATLNNLYHNPFLNTPGGFKGHPDKKGYITRLISWQYSNARHKCRGKSVHNICVFSALDLPILEETIHLAANKFDLTFDPIAYACMEEFIENKTLFKKPFDLQPYHKLYFINFKNTTS